MQKQTPEDLNLIIEKIQNYCSYSERCLIDVHAKLSTWNLRENTKEKIIKGLIHDNFISEARYAKSFANGKFKINRWGKNKILYGLRKKQIPDIYIQIALNDIDREEYISTIKEIILTKFTKILQSKEVVKKNQAMKYLYSRGFETSIVSEILNTYE
ncbi:MAG: RecX family transcriptional regulator [Bacteroidales bacterium]|nr:RecX family transcriptional regulator [Bacteroidales bacterium]